LYVLSFSKNFFVKPFIELIKFPSLVLSFIGFSPLKIAKTRFSLPKIAYLSLLSLVVPVFKNMFLTFIFKRVLAILFKISLHSITVLDLRGV